MNNEFLEAAIEAILFSLGEPVSLEKISSVLEVETNKIKQIIETMKTKYEKVSSGIRLIELDKAYQLCTKNEYFDVISKIVNVPKKHVITDVLMETLSIVAYKQPITRQEIEQIRGVSCVHAINKLIEYNLIAEIGRLDAVGKPILFGTTIDFLRCFGVSSMDDLPVITADKIEDFKQQAMEEVNVKVEV